MSEDKDGNWAVKARFLLFLVAAVMVGLGLVFFNTGSLFGIFIGAAAALAGVWLFFVSFFGSDDYAAKTLLNWLK